MLDSHLMDRALKLHDSTLRGLLSRHSGYESATEGGAWEKGGGPGAGVCGVWRRVLGAPCKAQHESGSSA